jgi:hypothetical protein
VGNRDLGKDSDVRVVDFEVLDNVGLDNLILIQDTLRIYDSGNEELDNHTLGTTLILDQV